MTKLGNLQIVFKYTGSERQKTFITVKNTAGETLIETHVKRSVNDSHNKQAARFYAFRKAMHQLALRNLATKSQRKEAWNTYVKAVKLPIGLALNMNKQVKVKPIAIV